MLRDIKPKNSVMITEVESPNPYNERSLDRIASTIFPSIETSRSLSVLS